jgi:hypothetical protein
MVVATYNNGPRRRPASTSEKRSTQYRMPWQCRVIPQDQLLGSARQNNPAARGAMYDHSNMRVRAHLVEPFQRFTLFLMYTNICDEVKGVVSVHQEEGR